MGWMIQREEVDKRKQLYQIPSLPSEKEQALAWKRKT
jgi:hypothetical protein